MSTRCEKFGYPSEAAARLHLKIQKFDTRAGNKKQRTRLEAYLCPMHKIETWHIGHNAFANARSRRHDRRKR